MKSQTFGIEIEIFQFTPLREGRHFDFVMVELRLISIHAPPRGATRGCGQGDGCRCISIHAPPRGATKENLLTMALEIISIHAPPRGATVRAASRGRGLCISIHAPPRGATRTAALHAAIAALFQFTPLREGRRLIWKLLCGFPHFNSRPSARGDVTRSTCFPCFTNFNSRPSARGDCTPRAQTRTRMYFNSRPSARGDLRGFQRRAVNAPISIHAPPRGATQHHQPTSTISHFNSRPSARGDVIRGCVYRGIELFQFTPLREGRPALWR